MKKGDQFLYLRLHADDWLNIYQVINPKPMYGPGGNIELRVIYGRDESKIIGLDPDYITTSLWSSGDKKSIIIEIFT